MTYEHNIHLNCLQFLSEIFFNLYRCFIVPPQFADGNLMGKIMKQKTLACAKVIQHKRSDIQLQYQSTIFTEPKTNSHTHTILAVFSILSYKNSVHILIQYFKYTTLIFSPTSSKFFLQFLLSYVCSINTPSQLTWAV
jgi:hypothetical protein